MYFIVYPHDNIISRINIVLRMLKKNSSTSWTSVALFFFVLLIDISREVIYEGCVSDRSP
jgi:hypothetical protein